MYLIHLLFSLLLTAVVKFKIRYLALFSRNLQFKFGNEIYEIVDRGLQVVCKLLTNCILKTMNFVGLRARGRSLTRSNQRRPHVGFGTRDKSLSKDTLEGISCGDRKKHKVTRKHVDGI